MTAPTMAALPFKPRISALLALPIAAKMSQPNYSEVTFGTDRLPCGGGVHCLSGFPFNEPLVPHPNRQLRSRDQRRTQPFDFADRQMTLGGSQTRVLVVDDVNDVTEMISLFLKHAGYEVSTADSARAALHLAGERAFDLIISDIGMPSMNGYELAEALRRMPDYGEVPLIAVTGYTEYDDRGRSLRAGFNAHMTKPIDPTQLLDLINTLLR